MSFKIVPSEWFQGLRPSQIGVILRDSHGVAQVRRVTGNKIVRILKSKVGGLFFAVVYVFPANLS